MPSSSTRASRCIPPVISVGRESRRAGVGESFVLVPNEFAILTHDLHNVENTVFREPGYDLTVQVFQVDYMVENRVGENHVIATGLDLDEVEVLDSKLQVEILPLGHGPRIGEKFVVDVGTYHPARLADEACEVELVSAVSAAETEDFDRFAILSEFPAHVFSDTAKWTGVDYLGHLFPIITPAIASMHTAFLEVFGYLDLEVMLLLLFD